MTQPFDKVESSMGISSYMSTKNVGFAAVLKARYSDFVVHEGDERFACALEQICVESYSNSTSHTMYFLSPNLQ